MTETSELKPIIELLTNAKDSLAKSFQLMVDSSIPTERVLLDLTNEAIQKTEFVLNRLEDRAFRDGIARDKSDQLIDFDDKGRTII